MMIQLHSAVLLFRKTLPEKGKRWWRLVAILTFTSFVMLGQKGDRPTEQSSSLFPSRELEMNKFIR